MTQTEKARRFAAFHVKGAPLVLFNVWDAGSAKAVVEAGALAIATGSWGVAAAQGFKDGEHIPLATVQQNAGRIAASVEVPVTIDFEGGYSDDDSQLAENVRRLIDLGVVGVNFEDQVVGGEGLYDIGRQARRIAAVRKAADEAGVELFINARTDVFFVGGAANEALVAAALERGKAYADAGASGLFVPGLIDDALIGRVCEAAALPVNILLMDGAPSKARLGELGVGRISYGHRPYVQAMKRLTEEARTAFA